ncbi:MAG TPA: hypothetical protein VFJ19_04400 [Nocardioidaceae bacterium]|nr:hypothetical protein [Nocardioidaceae bacterium]
MLFSSRLRKIVLPAAAVLVAALAAGCSGGSSPKAGESGASASPSSSPSPSSTVSVPPGVDLTAQGTNLNFGDTATVIFEPTENKATVLSLTVKNARQGRLSDFKGFILDDPYKKKATYYYVKVRVKNVGTGDVGGVPVPLWGVNGANTLLPAVNFTSTFKKCTSKPLPKKFAPGDAVDTCLVYLSPKHGSLEAVSYRPSQEFNPIQWTGTVKH